MTSSPSAAKRLATILVVWFCSGATAFAPNVKSPLSLSWDAHYYSFSVRNPILHQNSPLSTPYFRRRTKNAIILPTTASDNDDHEPLQREAKRGKFMSNNLSFHRVVTGVSKLQSYLIPPIPQQDTSQLKWQEHFRPRFVAREALLGVWMMMRLYCPLVLIGRAFEDCNDLFPTLPLAPVDSLSPQSPLHAMEGLAKHLLLSRLPPLSFTFRLTVLGPIFEEIAYRGIGFLTTYWAAWLLLFALGTAAGVSPLLSATWALCIYATSLSKFLPLLISTPATAGVATPLLEIVRSCWLSFVPICFQLPPLIRILQLARLAKRQQRNSDGDDKAGKVLASTQHDMVGNSTSNAEQEERSSGVKTTKPISTIPEAYRRRNERIIRRATRRELAVTIDTSSNSSLGSTAEEQDESSSSALLACQIQHALLLITRWKTSTLFAAAHVPFQEITALGEKGKGHVLVEFLDSREHYIYLRKFLGVFASSFLVESRLVARRGNIWSACGAHMCFNMLTMTRLLAESSLLEVLFLGDSFLSSSSRRVAVLFLLPYFIIVVLQLALFWLGDQVERLEKHLATQIGTG